MVGKWLSTIVLAMGLTLFLMPSMTVLVDDYSGYSGLVYANGEPPAAEPAEGAAAEPAQESADPAAGEAGAPPLAPPGAPELPAHLMFGAGFLVFGFGLLLYRRKVW